MDLRLMDAEATDAERTAVDAVLGPPESGWTGAERTPRDDRIARAGHHRAMALRHLLLPTLHGLQSSIGWISKGGLNYVCERLGVPPAEAYGVASFYALLATEERPSRVAHVCDDIACKLAGADDIVAQLNGGPEGTAVITSPCLGQCERATAVLLQLAGEDDVVLAPATADAVTAALADEPSLRLPPVPQAAPQTPDESLRVLRRVGRVDPESLDHYRALGGYEALRMAVAMGPAGVIREVKDSGLVGRGGAAFPTGIKWEGAARQPARPHYLICNADESEPGTFKDRVLLEDDPFSTIEAMTIAGYAVGAEQGYLYVRGEYPLAIRRLEHAIDQARARGFLGHDVMGEGFDFDIEIRKGAGAYICGEETALFNSIEGYRGEPRNKPPYPTEVGLFGKPTVVNNVETLVNVLDIVRHGGPAFAAIGTERSAGPKLFCLSGHVTTPGVYEVEFGVTLGELIHLAGGVRGGATLRAVLLGGAAGYFVGPDALDMPLTFEGTRDAGATLGSGVVMLFDDTTDFTAITHRIAAFFRDESCGQCVPCRVGTVRQEEALARIATGAENGEVALLGEIARVMQDASICGLGHTAAGAVQSAIALGLVGGDR